MDLVAREYWMDAWNQKDLDLKAKAQALWQALADRGDPRGEFGMVDRVVVLEECGAAIAPIPLLSSVGLAAGALRACAHAFDDLLREITGGEGAAHLDLSPSPGGRRTRR